MGSSWKTFGRRLQTVVVLLLVVAVGYLWMKVDSQDALPSAEAPTAETHKRTPAASSDLITDPRLVGHESADTREATETVSFAGSASAETLELAPPAQTGAAIQASSCSLADTLSASENRLTNNGSSAEPVTLSIALPFPETSIWTRQLQSAAQSILYQTDSRVRFRFFSGGIAGDEQTVSRKLRIGSLQGTFASPSALQHLQVGFEFYDWPFLYESANEFRYVRSQFDEYLLTSLERNGYVSFGFADNGFALLMSTRPVNSLDDLRELRLWNPDGHRLRFQWAQRMGMQPKTLSLGDIYLALPNGDIEAVIQSPGNAIALQWTRSLNYVLDVPVAPSLGLLMIKADAFEKLSARDRQVVCNQMSQTFEVLSSYGVGQANDAKQALVDAGVELTAISPTALAEITAASATASQAQIGPGSVDPALYEIMQGHIDTYRREYREQ